MHTKNDTKRPLPRLAATVLACMALVPLSATASPQGGIAVLDAPVAIEGTAIGQDLQVMQGGGVSLNQAVEQVKRQCKDCRVVSAETKRQGNREVHHIKVLTQDNKVKTFRIQGRSLSSRG